MVASAVANAPDLWTLARLQPQIDPTDLSKAVVGQIKSNDLDYRTRLLIRDSIDALRFYWGDSRFNSWYSVCPHRQEIEAICREPFDEVGFPSLRKRLMDAKTPEQIRDYLETLGRRIRKNSTIYIAGSCALILPGLMVRGTDDIDVVDELPAEIRDEHQLLDELEQGFGLHLGHVQRHYFPTGWQDRAHSFGLFGKLQVHLVDVYDIFLSKLFSARVKDLTDLRTLLPQFEKEVLIRRLHETCSVFLSDERLKQIATDNWAVLFKEELPR